MIRETIRRALTSFLAIPTGIIVLFGLLAIGAHDLEQADVAWLRPLSSYMRRYVFGDAQATGTLLGTIATGLITITSITFSLLLLALQQSAGSLTHQVFDQFLQRRLNQVYFGFFVGLALYALIILATVDPPFNPVLGATLALVLTAGALYVLLLLIYSTVSQMRPTEIIKAIHDHTLRGRQREREVIRRTRRSALLSAEEGVPVRVWRDGFVAELDLPALERIIDRASDPVELEFLVPVGSYLAFGDQVAAVRARNREDADRLAAAVERALKVDRIRRLDADPAYGIEQLETIAWRSISTSQQNPAPGISVIRNLRDIMARWAAEDDMHVVANDDVLPIVYPDVAMSRLLGAFESLAVVASESMQHQTCAEILWAYALTFDRLPPGAQRTAEDLILNSLAGLGDHMLTARLNAALVAVAVTLDRSGRTETAHAVAAARADLATSIGELNSRATRVPDGE